jgi:glutamine synthetase|tara:strand:+ start:3447 stop:5630 length:2184 start_codon:yes stop_codon:yes gene_type:complete
METLRKNSLSSLSSKLFEVPFSHSDSLEFGSHVFNTPKLKQFLSEKAFQQMEQSIFKGTPILPILADQIAAAMKAWAISMGATHYTHWFQPLTGSTAEKHESFYGLNTDGAQIEKFEGEQLVQQVPEASNIANSGIRDTFEARGYTTWDPTSPAFIYDSTLCIPTLFISYTGESLDYKAPLIKSLQKLDHAATEICRYFDKSINKVNATLGWEQEYFLIDRSLALTRPDLILTGRTLLGHAPSKGQELNNQYFGSIPVRVSSFLNDLENECKILGIPVKTRHNEVAPSQYELAPVFESANLAIDHNALVMDVMNKVASKHNFIVLFHEKPFEKINGSGKHNNWSLITNTGVNLLSPGKTPMSNLQFLAFFVNTIAAVLKHEALLRASSVSASNDLRIGLQEAPSAMLSIFIGKHLKQVLEDLENVSKGKLSPQEKTDLKLNVIGKIPEILLDNTDKKRTSPFAFTGDKFEFRTVGSKANCAKPVTVFNAIVTEQLIEFKKYVDALIEDKNMKKDDAIFNTLRETITSIKDIFNNDEQDQTKIESLAKKKGLSNYKTTPEALPAYVSDLSVTLFETLGIFTKNELLARYEIDLESYISTLQIESRTLGDLAQNHIIPTAIKYQNTLIENVRGLKEIYGVNYKVHAREQILILERISNHIAEINSGTFSMIEARKKANTLKDTHKKALAYCKSILPYLTTIRYQCDKLELTVDDEIWPLAKYRELLFIR